MSWGYVPKKLRQARRYRRSRKKYKNFSCLTCAYGEGVCLERRKRIGYGLTEKTIVEYCKDWTVSEKAKNAEKNMPTVSNVDKKQPRKGLLAKIFK